MVHGHPLRALRRALTPRLHLELLDLSSPLCHRPSNRAIIGPILSRQERKPGLRYLTLLLIALTTLLTGCTGQVITRVTPTPTATPTLSAATPEATLRPTATPAPYTPAPTPTPTLTPTPIIYSIGRGDTLLGIAQQFGITVRELQETNGITDPRSLRVGQELIIPGPEDAEGESTPTVEPTPLPFTVENVTFSNSPLGGLWCFGEVYNATGTDLEQAGVTVALLDEDGDVVAQERTYVLAELLRPGERAPFALRFAAPPQSFAAYLASPWQGVRGYLGRYYLDLVAQDVTGAGERYATYTVTGQIANIGPEDAVDVVVTVTLYDALGRVIAARRAAPEHNVIPRGGQTTFSIELTPAGGPVASFRAVAAGQRVPTPTP